MRIVFAGTPDFARASLEALLRAGHDIALVLTQPDRPAGRGLKLQPSAAKAFALAHRLPVLQPRSLRLDGPFPDDAAAAQAALRAAGPEAMVVAAYGLILPPWTLTLPRLGCLNVHASVLPRWRGAAPIQRAIEAGDAATGVTIMQMAEGLDTGDMLLVGSTPIAGDDTAAMLHDRLAVLGSRLIVEALDRARSHQLPPTPQPAAGITYAHKIAKAEAAVDWKAPAAVIERRLRAFDPFPGATGRLGGETLKLWRGSVVDGRGPAGEILRADDAGIVVACGDAALGLTELQRPGGRRLSAAAFLAGRDNLGGRRFEAGD